MKYVIGLYCVLIVIAANGNLPCLAYNYIACQPYLGLLPACRCTGEADYPCATVDQFKLEPAGIGEAEEPSISDRIVIPGNFICKPLCDSHQGNAVCLVSGIGIMGSSVRTGNPQCPELIVIQLPGEYDIGAGI